MSDELTPTGPTDKNIKMAYRGSSDTVYALGLFGAWAYYFRGVTTFEQGVRAFFKGLFWPAFMVYALFKLLEKP